MQTVSGLFGGEIEHRDSVGSDVRVRPGELHLMTAGHGIVHSEISLADKPRSHSPLCGADLQLEAGAGLRLRLNPAYEYGIFIVGGTVQVEDTDVALDQLLQLGTGQESLPLRSGDGARLIGGEKVMEAPPMPTVAPRPRPRRAAR